MKFTGYILNFIFLINASHIKMINTCSTIKCCNHLPVEIKYGSEKIANYFVKKNKNKNYKETEIHVTIYTKLK